MPYAPAIICYLTSTEVIEQEGRKESLLSTFIKSLMDLMKGKSKETRTIQEGKWFLHFWISICL